MIVVIAVTVACGVIAIVTLAGSGKTYGQIGSGGTGPSVGDRGAPEAGVMDERDEEIRQLLEARDARRARRAEAPVEVDAEPAARAAPAVDQPLRDEVRQLVRARNSRRERKGQPPLDVEREVERHLRELT